MKRKVLAGIFGVAGSCFLLVDVIYPPAHGKAIYFAFISVEIAYLVR